MRPRRRVGRVEEDLECHAAELADSPGWWSTSQEGGPCPALLADPPSCGSTQPCCQLPLGVKISSCPALSWLGGPGASSCPSCLCAERPERGPSGAGPSRAQTLLCWLCLQERFVVHITDVLAVSMMLGITAQVKEAGIAWDKGEKKSKKRSSLESARVQA